MKKRCPDCDSRGEVYDEGWKNCPRCGGTMRIERDPMDEEDLFRWLSISCAVGAALCGLGAVGLLIMCATAFSLGTLIGAVGLVGGTITCAYYTVAFNARTTAPKVFNNQDEKEVLTPKQRKELKRARGEVVMEKAMIEVEHERANIVHNLSIEASDPDKPPHKTRWTGDETVRELRAHPLDENDGNWKYNQ